MPASYNSVSMDLINATIRSFTRHGLLFATLYRLGRSDRSYKLYRSYKSVGQGWQKTVRLNEDLGVTRVDVPLCDPLRLPFRLCFAFIPYVLT